MADKASPGKGVVQRPVADRAEYERRWDKIFGEKDEECPKAK